MTREQPRKRPKGALSWYPLLNMLTHPVFLSGFSLLVLLALAHVYAITHYWYWLYPWSDIGVHFLGGLVVGFLTLWIMLRVLGAQHSFLRYASVYSVMVTVLAIGTIWEVFEYHVGIPRGPNFTFDTALDMLTNVLGALSALLVSRKFFL